MSKTQPQVEYKVIELKGFSPAHDWDKETSAQVRLLATNPGFTALVDKLKLQRAVLESALARGKHTSIRDVDILQAGIRWISWMELTVQREVFNNERAEAARPPFDLEQKEFARMQEALTLVGLAEGSGAA